MADSTVISVDPPPAPDDFGYGLSVPPLDDTFFSNQLNAHDGENPDETLSIADLDFDEDFFEGLGLDLDQLLNPNDHQPQPESSFCQFASAGPNQNSHEFPQEVLGDNCSHGSGVSTHFLPGKDSNQFSGYVDARSPEFNGSDGKTDAIADGMSWPSPESQASGNCRSDISTEVSNNPVSSSPNSDNLYSKVGVVDEKIKLDGSAKPRGSLLKRKKDEQEMVMDNTNNTYAKARGRDYSKDNCGFSDGDDKKKARLMRNRESAQLSRQRKKHYVEELEDKVKSMNATIQDLNMKVSYFMAENVTLRQQMGGVSGVPPPPMAPGMYTQPAMMYPWMPYAPPYMVKPQGSQVPLVPIPRLKPQKPAQAPSVSKKVDSKKNEGRKVKKVAGVSFLGLLFFILLFGGLVPMINMRYRGVKETFSGRESYIGGGYDQNHHGRVLMKNGADCGGKGEFGSNSSGHCVHGAGGYNGTEPLTASLYVPRNDKLVKIDGNLIIHSVLASEKAMASPVKEADETGLVVLGDLVPAIPGSGMARSGARHSPVRALGSGSADKDGVKSSDGKMHEWFREGLAGPMLTSGMCTEVFQFDVSSAIVPAPTKRNISEERGQNSTQLAQGRNRRILYDHLVPIPESSLNISREPAVNTSHREKLNGNKNSSSMVVSVLVDPREVGDADIDGVMGTKSISRIFVVVLVDSVKYVTYSCMLPFKGSSSHLVTT